MCERHTECLAGSVLSDVTEAVGLIADEQTLTAGCIAEHMAAQVSSVHAVNSLKRHHIICACCKRRSALALCR